MKYLLLFSFLAVFFFSCHCHHEGEGYVYDEITKTPIVNARVETLTGVPGKDTLSPAVYTDSYGYFSYNHDYCKDMVTIHKKNYIGHSLSSIQGDTIFLKYLEGN